MISSLKMCRLSSKVFESIRLCRSKSSLLFCSVFSIFLSILLDISPAIADSNSTSNATVDQNIVTLDEYLQDKYEKKVSNKAQKHSMLFFTFYDPEFCIKAPIAKLDQVSVDGDRLNFVIDKIKQFFDSGDNDISSNVNDRISKDNIDLTRRILLHKPDNGFFLKDFCDKDEDFEKNENNDSETEPYESSYFDNIFFGFHDYGRQCKYHIQFKSFDRVVRHRKNKKGRWRLRDDNVHIGLSSIVTEYSGGPMDPEGETINRMLIGSNANNYDDDKASILNNAENSFTNDEKLDPVKNMHVNFATYPHITKDGNTSQKTRKYFYESSELFKFKEPILIRENDCMGVQLEFPIFFDETGEDIKNDPQKSMNTVDKEYMKNSLKNLEYDFENFYISANMQAWGTKHLKFSEAVQMRLGKDYFKVKSKKSSKPDKSKVSFFQVTEDHKKQFLKSEAINIAPASKTQLSTCESATLGDGLICDKNVELKPIITKTIPRYDKEFRDGWDRMKVGFWKKCGRELENKSDQSCAKRWTQDYAYMFCKGTDSAMDLKFLHSQTRCHRPQILYEYQRGEAKALKEPAFTYSRARMLTQKRIYPQFNKTALIHKNDVFLTEMARSWNAFGSMINGLVHYYQYYLKYEKNKGSSEFHLAATKIFHHELQTAEMELPILGTKVQEQVVTHPDDLLLEIKQNPDKAVPQFGLEEMLTNVIGRYAATGDESFFHESVTESRHYLQQNQYEPRFFHDGEDAYAEINLFDMGEFIDHKNMRSKLNIFELKKIVLRRLDIYDLAEKVSFFQDLGKAEHVKSHEGISEHTTGSQADADQYNAMLSGQKIHSKIKSSDLIKLGHANITLMLVPEHDARI